MAITDPNAGSDVANLTCTAKLSPCGKFYIVNGTKKWITNGTFCDYFVTAVRTGDNGIFGVSMLLIERSEGNILIFLLNNYMDNSTFKNNNILRIINKIDKNKLLIGCRNCIYNI